MKKILLLLAIFLNVVLTVSGGTAANNGLTYSISGSTLKIEGPDGKSVISPTLKVETLPLSGVICASADGKLSTAYNIYGDFIPEGLKYRRRLSRSNGVVEYLDTLQKSYILDGELKPIAGPFDNIYSLIETSELLKKELRQIPLMLIATKDGKTFLTDAMGRNISDAEYSEITRVPDLRMFILTANTPKNVFKAVGYSTLYNRLHESDIKNRSAILVRSAKTGKYGLLTKDGDELTPINYATPNEVGKSAYKKFLLPYLTGKSTVTSSNSTKEKLLKAVNEYVDLFDSYALSHYPQTFDPAKYDAPRLTKVTHKGDTLGYAIFKGNTQYSNIYPKIERTSTGQYITTNKNGYKGLITDWGYTILRSEYNNVTPWNDLKQNPIFLARKNGKYALVNGANPTDKIDLKYESVSYPHNNLSVGVRDGLQYLINSRTGKEVKPYGYDFIDIYSNPIEVTAGNYTTTLDRGYNESPSLCSKILEEASEMPNSRPQSKYNKLMQGRTVARTNEDDARVVYFIGQLFENIGDENNALEYYWEGKEMGHKRCKERYDLIRGRQRAEKIEAIGNALTGAVSNAANIMSGSRSINTYAVPTYSAGSLSQANPSSSSGTLSPKYYTSMYAKWEKNAKSCYESLVNNGVDIQKSGGTAAGSWTMGNYTSMLQNLRNAQREMRNIRQKAAKAGVTIAQSRYETINAAYD